MLGATPRHALGEKAIATRNQFANVGNPSEGRRESAEVRILRNLRETPAKVTVQMGTSLVGPNTMAADLGPFLAIVFGQPILANPFLAKIRG